MEGVLVGRLYFYYKVLGSDLINGFAIGGAEFIGGDVTVGFSGWSL